MDVSQLQAHLDRGQMLLDNTTALGRELGVEAPLLRIDNAIALGIPPASREQNANLMIMGWGKRTH